MKKSRSAQKPLFYVCSFNLYITCFFSKVISAIQRREKCEYKGKLTEGNKMKNGVLQRGSFSISWGAVQLFNIDNLILIISNQQEGLSANVRTLWLLSATSEWAILEATNLLLRVTARASDWRKDCQWSDSDPIKKVYFVKHALDHIWHDQTRAPKFCIWPYSGAYLCSPYINKWGIPETILQNAAHMRWCCVNRTPSQNLWPNLIIAHVKLKMGIRMSFMCL